MGRWLARIGVLPSPPSGDAVWGCAVVEQQRRLVIDLMAGKLSDEAARRELTAHMVRVASYRGSDVRLATSTLLAPNVWPRRPVPSCWWRWRVIGAFPMRGAHINAQEMTAALAALRWRFRRSSKIRARFAHLLDSQVCIGVLCKGRSSSQIMRRLLRKTASLLLCSSSQIVLLYVKTDDNPADAPSRWFGGE